LPFDYLWSFGFFYLVPLFIFFAKENKFWRLVLGTFIFRLIFYLGTVYYTLEPIVWISSIGIFLGLPITVFIVKKIKNFYLIGSAKNYSFIIHNSLFIILPFLWTFFDHLQARFSLLPTYIITAGNIFGSSPFLGLASISGLILLTFFAALINIMVALIILNFKNKKVAAIFLIIIITTLLIVWQIS
jgi:apolipoprotein N-acyltransferase